MLSLVRNEQNHLKFNPILQCTIQQPKSIDHNGTRKQKSIRTSEAQEAQIPDPEFIKESKPLPLLIKFWKHAYPHHQPLQLKTRPTT